MMAGEAAPPAGEAHAGPVAALILAAGESRRFGSDKRQALLPSGQSMLAAVIQTHRTVFESLWVVTPEDDAFAQVLCLEFGALQLICRDSAQGMARSLAAGLAHAQQQTALQAVLVSLADMPAVQPDTLRSLVARFMSTGAMVVPRYVGSVGRAEEAQRWGNPRVLPRAYWSGLLNRTGDQGAGSALDWSGAERVDVQDRGVIWDADTPLELARMPTLR